FSQAGTLNGIVVDPASGTTRFRDGFFEEALRRTGSGVPIARDPAGQPWTLERLARREPGFTARDPAGALTRQAGALLAQMLLASGAVREGTGQPGGGAGFPEAMVGAPTLRAFMPEAQDRDGWGRPIRLVRRPQPSGQVDASSPWHDYTLVSA